MSLGLHDTLFCFRKVEGVRMCDSQRLGPRAIFVPSQLFFLFNHPSRSSRSERRGHEQVTQGPVSSIYQRLGGLAAIVVPFLSICCVREAPEKKSQSLRSPQRHPKHPQMRSSEATLKSSVPFSSSTTLARKVLDGLGRSSAEIRARHEPRKAFRIISKFIEIPKTNPTGIWGHDSKSK